MTAVLTPRNAAPTGRVLCETDQWYFDPRYTDGQCPICGWRPAAGVIKQPAAYLVFLERVPWDLVGLGLLLVALILAGVFVGLAAGLTVIPKS